MKVVTIVGCRPQFIKSAILSRALRGKHKEILIHTGQHYDHNMSFDFFEELEIPKPDYHFDYKNVSKKIKDALNKECPDIVVVFGDTDSTLIGAHVASCLQIPIVHVEAGLRSYNKDMPEEKNRFYTDHLSSLLFCPSEKAKENLKKEGITDDVHVTGDIMFDLFMWGLKKIRVESPDKHFGLVTIHRNDENIEEIMLALNDLKRTIVFPVHPRTLNLIKDMKIKDHIHLVKPVGYLAMLGLLASCDWVMTDSGGLQKEAFWSWKPCLTLRNETEWTETVEQGWNTLVKPCRQDIINAVENIKTPIEHKNPYGDGMAAKQCVSEMEKYLI